MWCLRRGKEGQGKALGIRRILPYANIGENRRQGKGVRNGDSYRDSLTSKLLLRNSKKLFVLALVFSLVFAAGYYAHANPGATIIVYFDDYPAQAFYTIKTDGTWTWAVRYDGAKLFEATDAAAVIQDALDGLTAARTWKEKIVIRGSYEFTVAATLPIVPPDYVEIEIQGTIKLGNGVNKSMFQRQEDGQKYIEFHGGSINGNKAGQTTTTIDIIELSEVATSQGSRNFIHDIELKNAKRYALYFFAGNNDIIQNVQFNDNNYDIYLYTTEHTVINGCNFYGSDTYSIFLKNAKDAAISGNIFNYPAAAIRLENPLSNNLSMGSIVGNAGNPSTFISVNTNVLKQNSTTIRGNNFWNPDTGVNLSPISKKITNPFHDTSLTISPFGVAATPNASKTYRVWGFDLIISSTNSGNADNAIVIYDNGGNQINPVALSTLDAYYLPSGYMITWGAYTGAAPTVVACGI